jgi:hypothetical protein
MSIDRMYIFQPERRNLPEDFNTQQDRRKDLKPCRIIRCRDIIMWGTTQDNQLTI